MKALFGLHWSSVLGSGTMKALFWPSLELHTWQRYDEGTFFGLHWSCVPGGGTMKALFWPSLELRTWRRHDEGIFLAFIGAAYLAAAR